MASRAKVPSVVPVFSTKYCSRYSGFLERFKANIRAAPCEAYGMRIGTISQQFPPLLFLVHQGITIGVGEVFGEHDHIDDPEDHVDGDVAPRIISDPCGFWLGAPNGFVDD